VETGYADLERPFPAVLWTVPLPVATASVKEEKQRKDAPWTVAIAGMVFAGTTNDPIPVQATASRDVETRCAPWERPARPAPWIVVNAVAMGCARRPWGSLPVHVRWIVASVRGVVQGPPVAQG